MTPANSAPYLDAADRIGCRLCRDAVWAGPRCNWLGWALIPVHQTWVPAYQAQSAILYDGIAGIASFLAWLYHFTQDPIQKATFTGAVEQLRRALTDPDPALHLGFYSGLAGIVSMLLESSGIMQDEALANWGLALAEKIAEAPADPARLDVMNGMAGTIPVLLDVGLRFNRERLLTAAITQANFLLERAAKSEAGWSWDTIPVPGQQHLLGYAHGTAGIVCALLDAFRVTRDARYREAALEGLRYERSHFNAEVRNWPDFRAFMQPQQGAGATYPVAWCHGAPGIGFSRLRVKQYIDDPEVAQELAVAADTTIRSLAATLAPGQGNFSLCHGNAGNADLLLTASQVLKEPAYRQTAEAAGLHGIANYHQHDMPWPCGVMGAGESPNLMLGLAGIGYFYLRLHAPESVPSALMLMKDFAQAEPGPKLSVGTAAD